MSAASATAALPNDPDPPLDPVPASAPVPARTGRVLDVLRKLMDYGKCLAVTLHRRTDPAIPGIAARHFGTLNIALILMRIVRGLRLAAALEARLVAHPLREEPAPAPVRAPSDRAPRAAPSTAQRASRTPPQLSDVPTAEEIAAALRHRPVGAVIADICRDLGISQSHPLWDEVMTVVTEFGGNFVKLVKDTLDRVFAWLTDPSAFTEDGWPASWSQDAAAFGTGPP